jgi:uncharacterized protein YjaZ
MQCDEYMKTVSKMTAENLKNRMRTKFNKEHTMVPMQIKETQQEEATEMQFIPCCGLHWGHSAP